MLEMTRGADEVPVGEHGNESCGPGTEAAMEGERERGGASAAASEERPKEETIREARGCRERRAWKAKEGEWGKSIPHL